MAARVMKKQIMLIAFFLVCASIFAQKNVPLGIYYQAVARDNFGNELANVRITVRFSIIAGDPLGTIVYQECHQDVITSKFGVFSLVIGHGVPSANSKYYASISDIPWKDANHYLKVEVKFENDFMDMGTMQFLAVPYALYAEKSLEPGPQGPKGDQGDPATDDQTLSFNGSTLSISGGNTVPLTNLIQTLSIVPGVDGKYLTISGGNSVNITTAESDGDPTNELQDLILNASNNTLTLSKSTAPAISLNDADADPTNEIQTISYNPENYQLTLNKGGGTATVGQIIAYRAGIASTVNLPDNTPVNILFDQVSGSFYNDGGYYNTLTGGFTAPYTGIYSFSVSLNLPSNSSVILKLTGSNYETLIGPTTSSGSYKSDITMKLNKNDIVNVAIVQNNGFTIPSFNISGYFSGFRLY